VKKLPNNKKKKPNVNRTFLLEKSGFGGSVTVFEEVFFVFLVFVVAISNKKSSLVLVTMLSQTIDSFAKVKQ